MCVMLGADSSNYRLNTSGKKICKLFDKGSSLNFLVESRARKSPGCPRFFFGLFGKVRQKDFRVRFEIRLLTLSLNTAQHSLTLPNLFGTNLFDLPRSRQQTFFTFCKQFVTFFFGFSFFFSISISFSTQSESSRNRIGRGGTETEKCIVAVCSYFRFGHSHVDPGLQGEKKILEI